MEKGIYIHKEQTSNDIRTFADILKDNRSSKGEQGRKGIDHLETEPGVMQELSMREEEEWDTVGEEIGLTRQVTATEYKTQENADGLFKSRQSRRKETDRKKKENVQTCPDVSEDGIGLQNFQRRNNHDKGKKKWVPTQRQSVQRKGLGKLIIRENQGQMGLGGGSDNSSSSEEEGLFSEFLKWKGERGECSRSGLKRKAKEAISNGLVSGETNHGLQKVNFTRSASLDGPIKDYLDKMDLGGGLVTTEEENGLQELLISKSQSLDGNLKDYLDKLEQAFIRAKFQTSQMDVQPLEKISNQNRVSPLEESNSESSVSMVKETKASSVSLISEEDRDGEGDSFDSISATRERGEIESKATKLKRKGNNAAENKGAELTTKERWNEDEEVVLVMEIGARLGIDFKGKENEVADFIRNREREDIDRFGRNGGC
ncbi:hypothetical protein Q3G72_030337 [Acer saccharum]|nr:hypothetical protein Q3G72_030337 [Acer saccharum]